MPTNSNKNHTTQSTTTTTRAAAAAAAAAASNVHQGNNKSSSNNSNNNTQQQTMTRMHPSMKRPRAPIACFRCHHKKVNIKRKYAKCRSVRCIFF